MKNGSEVAPHASQKKEECGRYLENTRLKTRNISGGSRQNVALKSGAVVQNPAWLWFRRITTVLGLNTTAKSIGYICASPPVCCPALFDNQLHRYVTRTQAEVVKHKTRVITTSCVPGKLWSLSLLATWSPKESSKRQEKVGRELNFCEHKIPCTTKTERYRYGMRGFTKKRHTSDGGKFGHLQVITTAQRWHNLRNCPRERRISAVHCGKPNPTFSAWCLLSPCLRTGTTALSQNESIKICILACLNT